MSLRKPPQLTPPLLAAKRASARLSTGPRTPAGKQNSKMNALKHGAYAAPENHHQTMQALGEDPEEFENLKQELLTSFGPGDALWQRQIDDLAKLYWRRDRLQRAQAGVLQRALQAIEDWQHRRRQEMAGATFDASQPQLIDIDMTEPADPGVRLRMLLSFLEVIRAQVQQRTFKPRQASEIETLYGDLLGWRPARLCNLLRLFAESVKPRTRDDEELEELMRKQCGPRETAGEPQYQELQRLLEEEIASTQEEFEYAEKANEKKVAIERDACLAPAGDQWRMLLRQEGALDRSIDRKVRILLALRKESHGANHPASPADQGNDAERENIDTSMENVATSLGIALRQVEKSSVESRESSVEELRTARASTLNSSTRDQSEIPRCARNDRPNGFLRSRYSPATCLTQAPPTLGSRLAPPQLARPTATKIAGTKLECL